MKRKIKLFDTNLAHTCGLSDREPTNFVWDRAAEFDNSVVFFSETSFQLAPEIDADKKIAILMEPREVAQFGYLSLDLFESEFDFVLTHDPILLSRSDKYLWYPFGGCWVEESEISDLNKSEMISIIASQKNITEGHRLRHALIRAYGGRIHTFGRGYNPIDRKITGLGPYRFSVVIENSKTFFTEKLIDCLFTKTIPIYYGVSPLPHDIDENGILRFHNLDEFHAIYKDIEQNAIKIYEEKQNSIENNFRASYNYRCPEDWIWNNYQFLF